MNEYVLRLSFYWAIIIVAVIYAAYKMHIKQSYAYTNVVLGGR